MDAMFNRTQCLGIIRRQCLKGYRVSIQKHSEQPSEEDELDPTSRVDISCLIFIQNLISFLSGTGTVKSSVWNESLKNSNLHAKKETFLRADSVYEINGNISKFHSSTSLHRKTSIFRKTIFSSHKQLKKLFICKTLWSKKQLQIFNFS